MKPDFWCRIGAHDWSIWAYLGRPTKERVRRCKVCEKQDRRPVALHRVKL